MDVLDIYAKISIDTKDYEKGLDGASNNAKSFGGKLKSGLATAAKVSAAAIAAATAAIGAFAKSAIDAGKEFDAAMSQVAAISGATGKDFEALRDKAMEMGSKTKFSATESAEAFNYMAMAGWKTADMLNGIEGIMNLAAASGEDLATTSDIVTDALTAFGLSAKDSAHFADVLAVASSNANTNVAMMGDTFKYVAPVAGALGFSAEDVAEAIGLMANSGIKASQAGTALRAILSRLSTDAGASSDKLGALGTLTKELGVEFFDASGKARDLGDVLSEARVAWAKLSEEEQINYGNTIAGMEGMSAWMALMNASEADINKLSTALQNADGAAQKMAETMQDNLAGDITIFKSAMEGAKITLSDQLTPALREFVQFGTQGVSRITEAFKNGGLSEAMAELGTIISEGLSSAVENLPNAVEIAGNLLLSIVEGISQNLPALGEAASKIITSISEGIIENFPTLVENFVGGMQSIITTLTEGDVLVTLLDAAFSMIFTLVNGMVEALPTVMPQIVGLIMDIAAKLTEPETLTSLVTAAIDLILALANGLIESIPVLLERLPEIVTNIVMGLIEAAPLLVEGAIELIMALVGFLTDPNTLWLLIKAVPEIVIGIVKGLIEAAPKMIKSGIELLKKLWDGIQERFGKLSEDIKTIPGKIVGWLKEKFGEITSAGKDLVKGLWKGIKAMGNWIKEKVGGFFGGILDGIKGLFGIHSPSKVFAGIGRNLVEGFSLGFDQEFGKTKKDIISQMDELTDIEPSFSVYGSANGYELEGVGNVNIVQNIYSEAKTAADLQQEAVWYAKRGFLTGV